MGAPKLTSPSNLALPGMDFKVQEEDIAKLMSDCHVVLQDLNVSNHNIVATCTRKEVHFGSVETRFYPYIMGDHPQCSDGIPITFGWTFEPDHELVWLSESRNTISPGVAIHTLSPTHRYGRRTIVPRLPLVTRTSIWMAQGVSEEEIARCIYFCHSKQRRKRGRAKWTRWWWEWRTRVGLIPSSFKTKPADRRPKESSHPTFRRRCRRQGQI